VCEHLRSPQFGHNLNMLVQAIQAQTPVPAAVSLAATRLNRHYIPTRYPDAYDRGAPADQYIESDAHQALDDADQVVQFAEGVVGSS
jgi:HEPN domain-containing protein